MRPIFIPLTGKTDANGNATIRVPLERTGDWRNLKIVLGMSAPGEWAVLKSGIPVTYGRGRRVTLGPEVFEPFDVMEVDITGGPPNVTVGPGSVSGQAGTEAEVMAVHSPMPNTIALDTTQPDSAIPGSPFTLPLDGAQHDLGQVTLIPGTQAILVMCPTATDLTVISVVGTTSGAQYPPTNTTSPSSFNYIRVFPSDDPVVDLKITTAAVGGSIKVFVSLLSVTSMVEIDPANASGVFLETTIGNPISTDGNALGLSLNVSESRATPALWQAAQLPASLAETATGTFTLVPAVAGQVIRVFGWSLASDGVGASGTRSHLIPHGGSNNAIAWLSGAGGAGGVGAVAGHAGGVALPVNTALDFVVDFLAGGNTALAAVTYSQG